MSYRRTRIAAAAEELAARVLGRHGVVSVSDAYDDARAPFVLVLSTSATEAVRSKLPAMVRGFRVVVRRSEPIVPLTPNEAAALTGVPFEYLELAARICGPKSPAAHELRARAREAPG